VGFDGKRTMAVWVGRPDSQPVPGMIGREAAAPLLFEAFERVASRPTPFGPAPREVIAGRQKDLPPPLRHYGRSAGQVVVGVGPRIVFPPDGSDMERAEGEPLALKVDGGTGPYTVLVDGVPASTDIAGQQFFWQPAGAGFTRLTVMDANGSSDSVRLRIR
jgi:penicillin-binding protein 1C